MWLNCLCHKLTPTGHKGGAEGERILYTIQRYWLIAEGPRSSYMYLYYKEGGLYAPKQQQKLTGNI